MGKVRIYTRQGCEFSREAKQLLHQRGVPYDEIDVTDEPALMDEMVRVSGRQTTPQILIDGQAIGGASDLIRMDRSGELDELLGRALGQPGA